jgi:hypothetical protein
MRELILKYLGNALTIVSAIAIISGIAISNYKTQTALKLMMRNDSTLINVVKGIIIDIRNAKQDITDIKNIQALQGKEQKIIKWYVIKHITKDSSVTKDDLIRLFNDFEKKRISYPQKSDSLKTRIIRL